jgi:hypothetical protein
MTSTRKLWRSLVIASIRNFYMVIAMECKLYSSRSGCRNILFSPRKTVASLTELFPIKDNITQKFTFKFLHAIPSNFLIHSCRFTHYMLLNFCAKNVILDNASERNLPPVHTPQSSPGSPRLPFCPRSPTLPGSPGWPGDPGSPLSPGGPWIGTPTPVNPLGPERTRSKIICMDSHSLEVYISNFEINMKCYFIHNRIQFFIL